MKRRDFLKLSLAAGTASLGLAGHNALMAADASETIKTDAAPVPVYRTLGRTGLKVSIVGFGAMLTPEYEVIQAGLDLGINYIDTARKYMDGRNEEIVGKAIKGRRDKVILATKTLAKSTSKQDIIANVETSLQKLQTDYIDIIQLHNVDAGNKDRIFNPETREALAELKKQGKVRFFGVTTHTNPEAIVEAVASDPTAFFDTLLVAYNFKSSAELKTAIAKAAKAGIGIIGMKTQAGGYETTELGRISPHQAALKWVLQDTNIATTIPGMKDLAMLKEDSAVMSMKLTSADIRLLERYSKAIDGRYCRMCARCESTCPHGVAISTINRGLMYAEGYHELELARATWRELPANASVVGCNSCTNCTAKCAHGLDIGTRMQRVQALLG